MQSLILLAGTRRPMRGIAMALALSLTAISSSVLFAEHAFAETGDKPMVAGPSEASGEDLYHRGFYPEAMEEWKKAVREKHDFGAAYRLGEEYLDGKFVPRDIDQALMFYRIGAEGGDKRAQMDYGMMYDKGYGVKPDMAVAAKWYELSAQQDFVSAQFNIGTMYEDGVGVPRDPIKAYMYLLLASQNGFAQFAGPELDKLTPKLSSAEIKKASQMARDFRAAHPQQKEAP